MKGLTLGALLALSFMVPAMASPTYRVVDLGVNGSVGGSRILLNNRGQVAGHGSEGAFIWENGSAAGMTNLPGDWGMPTGINDLGQVTGVSWTPDQHWHRAWVWDNGQISDIGSLGGPTIEPTGINDLGQVVGLGTLPGSTPGDMRYSAFLWQGGRITNLSLGGVARADAINDRGQIAGYTGSEACIYDSVTGELTLLGKLGSMGYSRAFGISESGSTAGFSDLWSDSGYDGMHAFLWRDGSMLDLGRLQSTDCMAEDVNDLDEVVGWGWGLEGGNYRPFLWRNGTMMNLNSLIPVDSGWVLRQAYSINNSGWITGYGEYGQDHYRPYLLIPVPEPSGLFALGSGLLAVGLPWVRRRAGARG